MSEYTLIVMTTSQDLVNEIAEIAAKKDYGVQLELDIEEDSEQFLEVGE